MMASSFRERYMFPLAGSTAIPLSTAILPGSGPLGTGFGCWAEPTIVVTTPAGVILRTV